MERLCHCPWTCACTPDFHRDKESIQNSTKTFWNTVDSILSPYSLCGFSSNDKPQITSGVWAEFSNLLDVDRTNVPLKLLPLLKKPHKTSKTGKKKRKMMGCQSYRSLYISHCRQEWGYSLQMTLSSNKVAAKSLSQLPQEGYHKHMKWGWNPLSQTSNYSTQLLVLFFNGWLKNRVKCLQISYSCKPATKRSLLILCSSVCVFVCDCAYSGWVKPLFFCGYQTPAMAAKETYVAGEGGPARSAPRPAPAAGSQAAPYPPTSSPKIQLIKGKGGP